MNVKDLQLYTENNKYYLSALFGYEDKNGIYELSVPKIEFPISSKCSVDCEILRDCWDNSVRENVEVDFGFGKLNALPFDDEDHRWTVTCLEEKVHEMTLDEIEKELGYKIKLKKEN